MKNEITISVPFFFILIINLILFMCLAFYNYEDTSKYERIIEDQRIEINCMKHKIKSLEDQLYDTDRPTEFDLYKIQMLNQLH